MQHFVLFGVAFPDEGEYVKKNSKIARHNPSQKELLWHGGVVWSARCVKEIQPHQKSSEIWKDSWLQHFWLKTVFYCFLHSSTWCYMGLDRWEYVRKARGFYSALIKYRLSYRATLHTTLFPKQGEQKAFIPPAKNNLIHSAENHNLPSWKYYQNVLPASLCLSHFTRRQFFASFCWEKSPGEIKGVAWFSKGFVTRILPTCTSGPSHIATVCH